MLFRVVGIVNKVVGVS